MSWFLKALQCTWRAESPVYHYAAVTGEVSGTHKKKKQENP